MKKLILLLIIYSFCALKIVAQPTGTPTKFIPWVIRISETKSTKADADAAYNTIVASFDKNYQWMKQYKDQIGIFQIKQGDLFFVGVLPSRQTPNAGRYYKSVFQLFYNGADDVQICNLSGYSFCPCDLTAPCWPNSF